MFCINCGATVDDESIFCTNCGKRIKADPVVTVAEQEAQSVAETPVQPAMETPVQSAEPENEPAVPQNAPVQPEAPAFISEQPAAEIPAPSCTSYTPAYNQPPVMPYVPEKPQAEKVYFGKGALAFCLVIIGLLAISTGVFAGLYFSLL